MREQIKGFGTLIIVIFLPLLMFGCQAMDNDGKASNDGTALFLGIVGVLCIYAGLEADRPSAGVIIVGVILILA